MSLARAETAWTDEDRATALKMANEGKPNHEIGRVLGRTQNAVASAIHMMRRDGHDIVRRKAAWNEEPVNYELHYEGRKGAELLAQQITKFWHDKGRKDVFCVAEIDGGRWIVRSNLVAGKPVASVRP